MKDAIGTLPREVMRFIQERIDSVPELETLLMMSEDPRPWSAAEISRRVYVSPDKAEAVLEALVRQKLVAPGATPGIFEFRPADDRERALIGAVKSSYRKNLSLIATLIHEKAPGSVREFARAFDLKKDN